MKKKTFANEMKLYKSPLLQGGIDFEWQNGKIWGTFARFGSEINIQAIFSSDENKGNCQHFIKKWQEDLKSRNMMLVSSIPISEAWRHICNKFQLKIYEEEEIPPMS